MPPVMVRGGGYTPPRNTKNRRKNKPAKRRYDIALATPDSPGVEIRLPSIPVVQFSWRILSFMMVAGLIGLLYFMWTSPTFQVQMVELNGALRLTTDDINRTLNVTNKPIFVLDPEQMVAALMSANAELKDVTVQVGLPATVLVNVTERVPLIAWMEESGNQWIDGEGFAFQPRGEIDKLVKVQAYASPPIPVQPQVEELSLENASVPKAFMSTELVSAILKMRAQVPAKTDLVYDSDFGLGWKDSRGWDVFFGMNGNDIETKLLVYQSIVERLHSEGVSPLVINLEHVDAPYYRMEQ